MATKLYLRNTTTANAPTSGEKSSANPQYTLGANNAAGTGQEDLALSETKGSVQTSLSFNSDASTATRSNYLGRWTSPLLAAATFGSGTWTFAYCVTEGNSNADSFLKLSIYIWRPGTSSVVGYIYDSTADINTEWPTLNTGRVDNITGSNVTCQGGDVLVLEVWRSTDATGQAMATAYSQSVFYDGGTDITNGASITDGAAYLLAPGTISFSNPATKDAPSRFKLNVQAYKDAVSRFKLNARAYKDGQSRFKLTVQGYKDGPSRFKLNAQAWKDGPSRFKLAVLVIKDAPSRFVLNGLSYAAAVSRFIMSPPIGWVLAPSRFKLVVQAWKDSPSRFKLAVRSYKDAASRFVLNGLSYALGPSRFKLVVQAYKDAQTRFKLTARGYTDAVSRYSLAAQAFKLAQSRFKLTVQAFKDAQSRFVLSAGFIDAWKDAQSRFKLGIAAWKDAQSRFYQLGGGYGSASSRFSLATHRRIVRLSITTSLRDQSSTQLGTEGSVTVQLRDQVEITKDA